MHDLGLWYSLNRKGVVHCLDCFSPTVSKTHSMQKLRGFAAERRSKIWVSVISRWSSSHEFYVSRFNFACEYDSNVVISVNVRSSSTSGKIRPRRFSRVLGIRGFASECAWGGSEREISVGVVSSMQLKKNPDWNISSPPTRPTCSEQHSTLP